MGFLRAAQPPHHPQGNGQSERFNRALIPLVKTLELDHKGRWPDHLQAATVAYNSTAHSTPFALLYGRKPRLPKDVNFTMLFILIFFFMNLHLQLLIFE